MDALTARPRLLKQANLSLVRKAIKAKGTATRAEIASETNISSTTVRSLLTQMVQDGELESIGYDESSGGRKAERYSFKPNRYYSVAFCMTKNLLHGLLVNICGEVVETTKLPMPNGSFAQAMMSFLDAVVLQKEIKAIGIGVPGAVEGDSFWIKNSEEGGLCKVAVSDAFAKRYGIPVIMENDLNAIAIGFGLCYHKQFPHENPESTNMAYLHFEKDCVSAGFIAGGRIIRGCNNFAGELGLIPMEDGRPLDTCISQPMDDLQYSGFVIKIVSWICGILNPQYVALGGPSLRKECIAMVTDGLAALLPKHMMTEILYAPVVWHDYHNGMAYLAAGKMFDDIQFTKE